MNHRIGPSGLLLFYIATFLSVAIHQQASAQATGRITVTVTNRTTGEALGNQEVEVLRHMDEMGEPEVVVSHMTDRNGRYVFEKLPLDGAHYVVGTRYFDVPYTTNHLTLDEETPTHETMIDVFETSPSDQAIEVSALHLIIDVSPDLLDVTEIVIVRNTDNKTFAPEGHDSSIALTLPAAAFGLQPVTPGVENTDHGVRYTQPVPPGESQIFFSYRVDRKAIEGVLTKHLEYDTGRVQVFVLPSTQTVSGTNLTNDGVRQVGDRSYMTLSNTVGLSPGMSIGIELPSVPGWQDYMKWGVLGLVALMVIAGVVAMLKAEPPEADRERQEERPERTPEQKELAEQEFDQLLHSIAGLDDEYEGGEVEEKVYRRRRKNLKRRAIRLRTGA